MIMLGIILIIIGGMLFFAGNNINNDLDAQMDSILNDGMANPGSDYETFGILLLVVGFLIILIGVIVAVYQRKPTCSRCGATVESGSEFCVGCGAPLLKKQEETTEETSIVCPHCNGLLPEGSKYCMHCGGDLNCL